MYVDTSISNRIDESSLLRLDPIEILDLDNQDSKFLDSTLTSPKTIIEIPTKAYIHSLHEENERSRRDLGIDFYDESSDLVKSNQDNDLNDKKLTNLDSITVNRESNSDNEVSKKKCVDDTIGEGTLVRFNRIFQNYLKISVGNDIKNLTKHHRIQLTDVTRIRSPNTGVYLLQIWVTDGNDKNNNSKIDKFIRLTKTNSRTGNSGATALPPIGDSFMYIETSNNDYGNGVFVSFERTDVIQISNISFY